MGARNERIGVEKKFEGGLEEAPEVLSAGRFPIAGLSATLQLVNRQSQRDRFHSVMFLPSGPAIEEFANTVTTAADDALVVNGESTDFDTLVGTVEDGDFTPGVLFKRSITTVVIKCPEALPLDAQKAVERVMSDSSYTYSKNGLHETLNSTASIMCLSSPIGGGFETEMPLLNQVETPPQIIRATDLLVADAPELGDSDMKRSATADTSTDIEDHDFDVDVDEPTITGELGLDINVAVSTHEDAGRFTNWPSKRSSGLFTEEEISETMRKLATGFARCMGAERAVTEDHGHPTFALMETLMQRTEYVTKETLTRGEAGEDDQRTAHRAHIKSKMVPTDSVFSLI